MSTHTQKNKQMLEVPNPGYYTLFVYYIIVHKACKIVSNYVQLEECFDWDFRFLEGERDCSNCTAHFQKI